ncbi:EF-hand domain-containing protein [Sphingomonas morindae]|uniref:Signal transduction protein n=1 Tax=Sphingomonas morindae TaxID=1541170 RepID=A0ABY4XCT9_9SPHN|nr:signal transduction protein [Sphingomonas morindae]USI74715.1 signal transduction protein [Sphingomonas morindae]
MALSFATLAVSLLAAPALAQPAPAPVPAAGAAPEAGGLTLDTFLMRQTGRIMAADRDGDGRISRAEMMAAAPPGRDPSRRFDAMDTNHDNQLDAGEIRAALTQRFRRMDRNGDGVVTREERMAARGHGRGAADPQS